MRRPVALHKRCHGVRGAHAEWDLFGVVLWTLREDGESCLDDDHVLLRRATAHADRPRDDAALHDREPTANHRDL